MKFNYDAYEQLCSEKGKSTSTAAQEAGISRTLPGRWKTGSAKPSNATIKKLAEYFDVPVTRLLREGNASDRVHFSAVFKRLCKQNRVTQKQALADMGFGVSTNQKWKTGTPQSESLQKIAAYFGVTTDWLLAQCSDARNAELGNIATAVTAQDSFDHAIQLTPEVQAHDGNRNAEQLSEQEAELLRVFRALTIKGQTAVMSCAYLQEEQQSK